MVRTTSSVLITGANRGLGLEWARQYAEAGWRVYASCRRPIEAEDLYALGRRNLRLSVHRLDVTDSEQLRTLQLDLEEARVDVLLNRARPAVKRAFQLIGNGVGLLTSTGLFYFGLLATYENFVRGTKIIKVMPIPKFLPLIIVPIMAFVLFFVFLFNLWEWWRRIPLIREQQEKEEDLVNL